MHLSKQIINADWFSNKLNNNSLSLFFKFSHPILDNASFYSNYFNSWHKARNDFKFYYGPGAVGTTNRVVVVVTSSGGAVGMSIVVVSGGAVGIIGVVVAGGAVGAP